jgi:hypothetical protein
MTTKPANPTEPTMSTPVMYTTARWKSVSELPTRLLAVVAAVVGIGTTGCQVDVGGQTLPSAYYLQDDIQYFPAGPEFKLSKEAAAQKAYRKEMTAENRGGGYQP